MAVKRVTKNKKRQLNSQNYLCNINKILFVFFGWAYKKHYIETDIMNDVERIKPKQKKKERLSIEEIEACRESIKNIRERALFELMMSTGMRVGEIAALRIEHIDFAKRTIHIPEGKTDSAERDVFLTVKARNALKKYLDERTSGYVFRPAKNCLKDDVEIGKGTLENWVKGIGKRAGCHCITTVHVFRKTFASEEYRRTKNIKYVSILLGHSSTAVTEKFYLIDDMKDIAHMALSAA
jgi:integrase